MRFFGHLGRRVLDGIASIGSILAFTGRSFVSAVRSPLHYYQISRQLVDIGFYSLPVVGLTAIFTGMVLALQSHTGFSRFAVESGVPGIVVVAITRELGPVLASLMVAGRIGSAMAAEIGTMRVTEQIDALRTLSADPFSYLIAPRLIGAMIAMPLLVLIADTIGVLGGYIVGVFKLGFSSRDYFQATFESLYAIDVISGLIKAVIFGLVIAAMGCYHGYYSQQGAEGVGSATTKAVASAMAVILMADYGVTEMFFSR